MTDFVDDEAIHTMFSLTYANYLVLHRSLLQSMPSEWQRRFVGLIEELDAAYDHLPRAGSYRVHAIDEGGRFARDPIPHYNRGRTYIKPHLKETQVG